VIHGGGCTRMNADVLLLLPPRTTTGKYTVFFFYPLDFTFVW
jgi:alkyl hydroperoxide reductase subunit AhpC